MKIRTRIMFALTLAISLIGIANAQLMRGYIGMHEDTRPKEVQLGPITLDAFFQGIQGAPVNPRARITHVYLYEDCETVFSADGEGGAWKLPAKQMESYSFREYRAIYRLNVQAIFRHEYGIDIDFLPECIIDEVREIMADMWIDKLKTRLGRPYDMQFRLDDQADYCTEFLCESFYDAFGFELMQTRFIAELNWQPFAPILDALGIDITQPAYVPADMPLSLYLELVWQNGFDDLENPDGC